MDGEIKKRSAGDQPQPADQSKKSKKADPYLVDETEVFFKISSAAAAFEMMSIFEFPWQKAEGRLMAIESDHGCDLRDVFFSSLVDGCRAAIEFPGDRLSPSPAPIALADESWPSDLDSDGVDCIWSCALREPLSLRRVVLQ